MNSNSALQKMKTVCVVVAHPDDLEICCFGTVQKLKENGSRVEVLIMTNGARGVEVTKKESELASVISSGHRVKEAETALNGVANIHWGNFSDGNLVINGELVSYVDLFLKKAKPDLVITHPSALPADHHDHYVTHTAVKNSIKRLPSPTEIWYFEPIVAAQVNWIPNQIVDISDHFQAKMEAIKKHKTQSGRFYLTEEWHSHRSNQNALCVNSNLFNKGKKYEGFTVENIVL